MPQSVWRLIEIHNPIPDETRINFLIPPSLILKENTSYYYLAIGSRLLPGQADEESSGRLCGVTLEELEHVAAGLGDRSHLGDDGQVVDDEAHLVLLVASQRLGVTQQSEA